jgi:hypothetical protein
MVGRPSGLLYTCPAGFHAILKSFYVTNQAAVAGNFTLVLTRGSPYTSVYLVVKNVPSLGYEAWEGWLVLEPGDNLQLLWDAGVPHVWGSGALLPLP